MDDAPNSDTLEEYVTALFAPEDPVLTALREEMRRLEMPEIQVSAEEGRLLQLLVSLSGARRVLEIGTLGGYSAIWIARGLPADGRVVTLEIDERHAAVASDFARRAQLGDIIDVRLGHALDSLRAIENAGEPPFDACFIDADKENYPAYLDFTLRLVRPGGLILGDNVFWSGRILDEDDTTAATTALREFNHRLAHDPRFLSTIVPVRDGLSISQVRHP